MKILVLRKQENPNFDYQLFLSKSNSFSTNSLSTEEACGAEIVMARYMYSIALNQSAFPQVQAIFQGTLQNFDQSKNQDASSILKPLELLDLALTPLHRLCNVMNDLLKSLVTQQQTLVPELRMTVLVSIRNILDCNANFLHLEQLRYSKDYDNMAKVCRASYSKASEAYQRLSAIGSEIQEDLVEFCQCAMKYFKTYGLWCILQTNEKSIRYENYKVKNYSILSSENLKIATEIMRVSEDLQKQKLDQYSTFTLNFMKICLLPSLNKQLKIYEQAKQNVQTTDEIFMGFDDSFDYFQLKQK